MSSSLTKWLIIAKITNIKIKADLSDDELFEKIYKKYKINKNDVTERRIIKKQIL